MLEGVIIERGPENADTGLPRPLARNHGTLRPVPWTNDEQVGWGIVRTERADACRVRSLCLVCGEVVEEGFIFANERECPLFVNQSDLSNWAADFGPMHARCAKITVAHCQHMRNELLSNEAFLIPYCRQPA